MKRALRLLSLIAVAFYATACRESDDPSDALSPEGVPLLAKMNGNDFYQCQTGNPRNSYCTWISGNLNRTHNQYFEDDVIPQKIRLDEAVGKTRVILEYGFRKGGSVAGDQFTGDYHGNYDFMASYDGGTGPSNPCNDKLWSYFCTGTDQNGALLSAFPFGTSSATPPVGDMSALTTTERDAYTAALARYDAAKRQLKVLNARDLVITSLVFTRSGDATEARMVFEFTAPDKASQVAILFGMHFAYEADWGAGRGAAGQSGSPFHTKIIEVRTGIQGNDYNTGKVLNNGAMAINVAGDVVQTFPSLSLTKSAGASVVNAGDVVSYTITITNSGTGAASNVTISDDLPTNAGLSWAIDPANANCSIVAGKLSCSFPTLGAGATASVTLKSPTTAATCGTISNTATASAAGTTVAGSPAGPVTIQVNCPTIKLEKTAAASTVNAGDEVSYTITVSNAGPGVASGVVITDDLPANAGLSWTMDPANSSCKITDGKLNCTFDTLAANASASVTLKSPTTTETCGTISNTAQLSASGGTVVTGSPAGPVTIRVNCPTLQLEKTAALSEVNAGDVVSYTIAVTNGGSAPASNVKISDDLPTNAGLSWAIDPANSNCSIAAGKLSCSFPTLAAGAAVSVTLKSPTTAATCGTISNTASASATGITVSGSPAGPVTIKVNCPTIKLEKTAQVATVNAGQDVAYTIAVRNDGPGVASGVVLSDDLPKNAGLSWSMDPANSACSITDGKLSCTFDTLAANTTVSVTLKSPTTTATCGTISNTARVSAAGGTVVTGSPAGPVAIQVICPTVRLTKAAALNVVSAGDMVSYTIAVKNEGPGTAAGVVITDVLPKNDGLSWSMDPANSNCSIAAGKLNCTFETLAVDATASVTLKSPTTAATCGTISNTAEATASGNTVIAGSPAGPVDIRVNCPALAITKTALKGTVNAGEDASFTITVRNSGTGDAIGVVMTDTLPNSGLTWLIQSATGSTTPTCALTPTTGNKQQLRCTVDRLAANGNFAVTVKATVGAEYVQDQPSPSGTPLEINGNPIHWSPLGINCQQGAEVGCKLDKPTGNSDDSFGQGTSEDSPVPTVVSGSIPNNKSDLLRFYVASERFVTTDYLYLAWRRVQAPTGTTNMDFELNQSSEKSSNGVTRVRTAGDLLIKFDLAKGGTTPTLGYHRWMTAASANGKSAKDACEAANKFPCWGKGEKLTHDVAAAINTNPVSDPIAPATAQQLDPLTFGEASINLQATGIFQKGVCVNFGSAYLKSRSSDSFNSEIKDFIAPVDITVTNCRAKTLDNRAWAIAAYATAVSAEAKVEVKPAGT